MPINHEKIVSELASCGKEQTVKIYRRHGVKGPLFGVSYADLNGMAKKIKTNTALALTLFSTKNHDASVLATKIVDPLELDEDTLKSWQKEVDNYILNDAVSSVVARTNFGKKLAVEWIKTKDEWHSAAGWNVLGILSMSNTEKPSLLPTLSEDEISLYLERIEKGIKLAPNRTRHAMNMCLIAFGLKSKQTKDMAVLAAKKIGKVVVDHGQTSCTTPPAEAYIKKTWDRKLKS